MATHATTNKKSSKGRKSAAIALAVVGVAGLSLASAAQLNVNDSSLGAGNSFVTSCQPTTTPITVSYTTGFVDGTSSVPGVYKTTEVKLGAIVPACGLKKLNLTVVGSTGAVVATGTQVTVLAVPANPTVVTIPATDAKLIFGVAVVISD